MYFLFGLLISIAIIGSIGLFFLLRNIIMYGFVKGLMIVVEFVSTRIGTYVLGTFAIVVGFAGYYGFFERIENFLGWVDKQESYYLIFGWLGVALLFLRIFTDISKNREPKTISNTSHIIATILAIISILAFIVAVILFFQTDWINEVWEYTYVISLGVCILTGIICACIWWDKRDGLVIPTTVVILLSIGGLIASFVLHQELRQFFLN